VGQASRMAEPEERRKLARRFVEQHEGGHQSFSPLMRLLHASKEPELAADIRAALGLKAGRLEPMEVRELAASGNLRGAVAASTELPDSDPKTVPTLDHLGRSLADAGESAESLPVYDRAIKIQPKRLVLRLNLARSQLKLGQYPEARRVLTELREQMPGFGDSDKLWAELKAAEQA
jgi:tetratricopeptide (TPR) repeat protein